MFEPIEIPLKGHMAIIGENTSGKSTILDAIQTVLLGGNGNFLKLNARSSESKSERTVKSYSLGYFRPEDVNSPPRSYRNRDEAFTYIGLVFRDENKNRFVNAFLGIEAHASRDSHEVKLYGLSVNDNPIKKEDFITTIDEENYKVKSCDDVRRYLQYSGHEVFYGSNSTDYMRELYNILGPDNPTFWIEPNTLKNVFSKSVSMSEVKDISLFVENFILETSNLDLNKLVNDRTQYEELVQRIKQLEQQVNDLGRIKSKAIRYTEEQHKLNLLEWFKQKFILDKNNENLEAINLKIQSTVITYIEAKRELIQLKKEKEFLTEKRNRLQSLIDQDDAAQQQRALQDEINQLHEQLNKKQRTLDHFHRTVYEFSQSVVIDNDLKNSADFLIDRSEKKQIDYLFEERLKETLQKAEAKQDVWKKQYAEAIFKREQENSKVKELNQFIQNAEANKINLLKATERLIKLLEENGIKATPLCYLAECTNIDWQPAIEAFLGNKTEALIVDLDQEEEALRLYREFAKQRNLEKSIIVKGSQSKNWLATQEKGYASSLMISDNEIVSAYLNKELGALKLVNTVSELKGLSFGLAPNGVFVSNGIMTSETISTSLKIVKDQTENINTWKEERNYHEQLLREAEEEARELDDLRRNVANSLNYFKDNQLISPSHLLEEIAQFQERLDRARNDLENIDFTYVDKLKDELKDISEELELTIKKEGKNEDIVKNRLKDNSHKRNLLTEKIPYSNFMRSLINSKEEKLAEIQDSLTKLEKIEQSPFYKSKKESELLLQYKTLKSLEDFDGRSGKISKKIGFLENDLSNEISTYKELNKLTRLDTNENLISKEDVFNLISLVKDEMDEIADNSLISYRQEAEKAQQKLNDLFRSDVLHRLGDSFKSLYKQLSTLNDVLKTKEFHGEIYRFIATPKHEFKLLIDYIKNTSSEDLSTTSGDLFDTMPLDIKEQIDRLLELNSTHDDIVKDYRKYFTYDVQITNIRTNSKTWLSKLLKTGSGGEKQSPFYVATAASLASAWRTLNKEYANAGIALFDEAFSNLDETNLRNAIEFMEDMGLQVIVATPSEKEFTFKQVVDTTAFVQREVGEQGMMAYVISDILTEKGKQFIHDELTISA